ncbi:hypothetical protein M9H77_07564 [Catharanthus roseus]|uniref:Uncharacterized protein n=1 Tax=Catharanthus roseus TaxID=4058 RepID=A0ACC0BVH1_CATRO|nr:hypothetical protein M9H77_07564 [Catharanthus roseus]
MYEMMNYQRDYDEYHEGYDHGAHTHEGYNFGAYGRNDDNGRWRYRRSMNAFHGNGSYGDEPVVERRWYSLVELNIVGFALEFDRNSLQHVFTIISMRGRRHTMEFEGEGKNSWVLV